MLNLLRAPSPQEFILSGKLDVAILAAPVIPPPAVERAIAAPGALPEARQVRRAPVAALVRHLVPVPGIPGARGREQAGGRMTTGQLVERDASGTDGRVF